MKGFQHAPQPWCRSPGALPSSALASEARYPTAAAAHDALMVLRPGLNSLRRHLGSGFELGHVERFEPLAPAEKHAQVGPVEFVGRAGQEVAAPLFDINKLVGCEVNGINERQRVGLVRIATARATSLIVPRALEAAPIAISRVRWSFRQHSRPVQSSSPVLGIIGTCRIVIPRSRSSARQGSMLA